MLIDDIEGFVKLALDGIRRHYPYHFSFVFRGEERPGLPSEVHPVFCGCYDWHSAVHGHWLLAKALSLPISSPLRQRCLSTLDSQLQPAPLLVERSYLLSRPSFERPYGLAWLLALSGEIRSIPEERAAAWSSALAPVESVALTHLVEWLPKLSSPIRTGTHNQTAFALSLMWDWSLASDRPDIRDLLTKEARRLYGEDRDYPLHLEPSGEDFLSPSLSSTSLMSRVLPPHEFQIWLRRVIPKLQSASALIPATVTDPEDGRLAHLDGLNLSRAWMLRDLIAAQPEDESEMQSLRSSADAHREAGLGSISLNHYSGAHWLGTFATYLLDRYPR